MQRTASPWRFFAVFCVATTTVTALLCRSLLLSLSQEPPLRQVVQQQVDPLSDERSVDPPHSEETAVPSEQPPAIAQPAVDQAAVTESPAAEPENNPTAALPPVVERVAMAGDSVPATAIAKAVQQPEVASATVPANPPVSAMPLGRQLFTHQWQRQDPLSHGDGLGPVFNARSCAECHFQGGEGGSGTNAHNVQSFEVLPRKKGGLVTSGVIHAFGVNADVKESVAAANTELEPGKVWLGSRRSNGSFSRSSEIDALRVVWINTPALWGNGVIDQISKHDLERHRPQSIDVQFEVSRQKQSSGRSKSRVPVFPLGRLRKLEDGAYGKFGWKGQFSTLRGFVAAACANELGLSTVAAAQAEPRKFRQQTDAVPDLREYELDALVKYVADLPAPRQVLPVDRQQRLNVAEGRALFRKIGCERCHVENVGPAREVYSDFQLHDIGSTGSSGAEYYPPPGDLEYDPRPKYVALTEWKTPPLWGVADTAPYWHDGVAQTLEEAIRLHDVEGEESRRKFEKLDDAGKRHVLDFLATLRAPGKAPEPAPIPEVALAVNQSKPVPENAEPPIPEIRESSLLIRIDVTIDGQDELQLTPERATWSHKEFGAPKNAQLNGIQWDPEHKSHLENSGSTHFLDADVPFGLATMEHRQARGSVRLLQDARNNITLQFDDPQPGADLYSIIVKIATPIERGGLIATELPQIQSILPQQAAAGQRIRLTGEHLGEVRRVYFATSRHHSESRFRIVSPTELELVVPDMEHSAGTEAHIAVLNTRGVCVTVPLTADVVRDTRPPKDSKFLHIMDQGNVRSHEIPMVIGPGGTAEYTDKSAWVFVQSGGTLQQASQTGMVFFEPGANLGPKVNSTKFQPSHIPPCREMLPVDAIMLAECVGPFRYKPELTVAQP